MKKLVAIILSIMLIASVFLCGCANIKADKMVLERLGAPLGPSERYTIDSSNSTMTFEHTDYNDFKAENDTYIKKSYLWNDDIMDALNKILSKANVLGWNEQYIDEDVYDGEVWNLMIETADQTVERHGQNDYPKYWDDFVKGIDELFNQQSLEETK